VRWPLPDPAHAPLLDAEALSGLYRIAQQARGAAPGTVEVARRQHGDLRSPWRGSGLDYEESRQFQPGDDARLMNWRALARTGQPHVKIFREEHRPGVFVLVDRRASMRFGTRVRLKAAQAARAGALVSFAARRAGARVAGLVLEDDALWLPPATDEAGVFDLARAFGAPCPPRPAGANEPSLPLVLRQLAAALERGTQLYLASDFADLESDCRGALSELAHHHSPCALQVVDAAEDALPAAGRLHLSACHGGQERLVDSDNPRVRAGFHSAAGQFQAQRAQWFTALGIPCLRLPADHERLESVVPLP